MNSQGEMRLLLNVVHVIVRFMILQEKPFKKNMFKKYLTMKGIKKFFFLKIVLSKALKLDITEHSPEDQVVQVHQAHLGCQVRQHSQATLGVQGHQALLSVPKLKIKDKKTLQKSKKDRKTNYTGICLHS